MLKKKVPSSVPARQGSMVPTACLVHALLFFLLLFIMLMRMMLLSKTVVRVPVAVSRPSAIVKGVICFC